jgi:hypothetical protein
MIARRSVRPSRLALRAPQDDEDLGLPSRKVLIPKGLTEWSLKGRMPLMQRLFTALGSAKVRA